MIPLSELIRSKVKTISRSLEDHKNCYHTLSSLSSHDFWWLSIASASFLYFSENDGSLQWKLELSCLNSFVEEQFRNKIEAFLLVILDFNFSLILFANVDFIFPFLLSILNKHICEKYKKKIKSFNKSMCARWDLKCNKINNL